MMRVILKEPGKDPAMITIDGSLGSLQKLVGGHIEHVRLTDNVGILVDEEGKLKNREPNFFLPTIKDMLVGPVVFIGEAGAEFTDIQDREAYLVMKIFGQIEE